jgi:hypothetical protein
MNFTFSAILPLLMYARYRNQYCVPTDLISAAYPYVQLSWQARLVGDAIRLVTEPLPLDQ